MLTIKFSADTRIACTGGMLAGMKVSSCGVTLWPLTEASS